MRVFSLTTLPALTLAALLACAPPNPENDAPFIELVSPEGYYDEDLTDTRYFAFAGRPVDLVFRFQDRLSLGDTNTVTIGVDPTLSADPLTLTDTLVVEDVPLDEDVLFTLPDGFIEGESDLVVVANDNLGPSGTDEDGNAYDRGRRIAKFRFTTEAVDFPTITPAAPLTTDDLAAALPNPTNDAHEYRWLVDGVQSTDGAGSGPGAASTLPASLTSRGQNWEFCVDRWDILTITDFDADPPVPLLRPDWPEPDLTLCADVDIGNSAPEAPVVIVSPNVPNATTALLCEATATDADGDATTIAYAWTNGTDTAPGQWLDPSVTSPGETWSCVPTASDDELTGDPTASGNSLTLRAGSVTLNAGLVSGGLFSAAPGIPVAIAPVINNGGPQTAIFTGEVGTCPVYDPAVPAGAPIYSLTGEPTIGSAVQTADLDVDGVDDLLVSADGAVYTIYAGSLPDGGASTTASLTSSHILVDVLDDTGFGTALTAGQLRDVAGDDGNLEVAVAWKRPIPPHEVRVYDGDLFATTGTTIPVANQVATVSGGTAGFGAVVLADGDFDGDGLDDLVITDSGAAASEVAVSIHQGGAALNGALTPTDAVHRLSLDTAGGATEVGAAAVYADIDADGLADLVLGAPGDNGDTGAIYVIRGGTLADNTSADLATVAVAVITGSGAGDRFGASLAVIHAAEGSLGDSVAVGAPGSNTGSGGVYLFHGTDLLADSTTASASLEIVGNTGSALGVSTAGDLDGDGWEDLIVTTDPGGSSRFWIMRTSF